MKRPPRTVILTSSLLTAALITTTTTAALELTHLGHDRDVPAALFRALCPAVLVSFVIASHLVFRLVSAVHPPEKDPSQ